MQISILNYAYMITLSICFLIGGLFFKSLTKDLKIYFYYIVPTFLIEWYGLYFLYFSSSKSVATYTYSFYIPSAFLILCYFYFRIIINIKVKKVLLLISPIITIILFFFMYSKNVEIVNFQVFLVSNFTISIYSIIFLMELLKFEGEILKNPFFWIVTGTLFFNSSFFFLSGFINFIYSKNIDLARQLFSINHILNIIYYSLITYGFICQRRLAKSSL